MRGVARFNMSVSLFLYLDYLVLVWVKEGLGHHVLVMDIRMGSVGYARRMTWSIGVMRRMGGMGSNGHYDDYPRE